jgi:hypothetical protein
MPPFSYRTTNNNMTHRGIGSHGCNKMLIGTLFGAFSVLFKALIALSPIIETLMNSLASIYPISLRQLLRQHSLT